MNASRTELPPTRPVPELVPARPVLDLDTVFTAPFRIASRCGPVAVPILVSNPGDDPASAGALEDVSTIDQR